jgi:hypothetical protein
VVTEVKSTQLYSTKRGRVLKSINIVGYFKHPNFSKSKTLIYFVRVSENVSLEKSIDVSFLFFGGGGIMMYPSLLYRAYLSSYIPFVQFPIVEVNIMQI